VIAMQIPFSMLKGPAGMKAAALLALLAGLAIATAIKNKPRAPAQPAPRAQPPQSDDWYR
jgi:hypothetical protein